MGNSVISNHLAMASASLGLVLQMHTKSCRGGQAGKQGLQARQAQQAQPGWQAEGQAGTAGRHRSEMD